MMLDFMLAGTQKLILSSHRAVYRLLSKETGRLGVTIEYQRSNSALDKRLIHDFFVVHQNTKLSTKDSMFVF